MLDDFRDAEFIEDDLFEEDAVNIQKDSLVFGMTSMQRFVLVVLFFLSMCMLGSFCLLVTDKIALPLY